jgi:O-antigen ligase
VQQVSALEALLGVGVLAVVVGLAVPALARSRVPLRVLVGGYALVVPFGSAVTFAPLPDGFDSLSSLVGGAVIAGLLPHVPLLHGRGAPPPPTSLPWLVLVAWAGLSLTWSVDVGRSLGLFVGLLSSAVLYAVAVHADVDRRDLRWIALGSAAGGIGHSAYALVLGLNGQIEQTGGTLQRFSTEGGDPNHTAAALLLPLAVVLCWSVDAERTAHRLAARVGALLLVSAILLTGSRGGLLGAVVALVSVAALARPSARKRLGVTALALVLAGAATFVIAPADVQYRFTKPNATGRTQIWEVGLASCRDGCWVGDGWGTFASAYRETWLHDLSLTGAGDAPWASHSIAMSALVEAGIVGLMLLLVAAALTLRALLRLPPHVRSAPTAALLALLASGLFVASLSYKYFWLTLLFAAVVIKVHDRPPRPAGRPRSAPVAAALTIPRQEDP